MSPILAKQILEEALAYRSWGCLDIADEMLNEVAEGLTPTLKKGYYENRRQIQSHPDTGYDT